MGAACVRRSVYSEALVEAAEGGHHDLVKALIKAGADVNHRTGSGRSALMRTATRGHALCVSALLGAGADVNITDSYQETALVCAAVNGHADCLRSLIRAGTDVNRGAALVRTAGNGYDECVSLLLKAGADVSRHGSVALIEAVKQGSHECVDLLIRAGADVNACDDWKDTALLRAAKDNRYRCVALLLGAGADVNAVDREGNTSLMAAVDNRNDAMHMWTARDYVSRVKCVALLLAAGADVNRRNRYGQNTLDLHMRRDGVPQDEGVAPLLLAAGETLQGPTLRRLWWDSGGQVTYVKVPGYLLQEESAESSLRGVCRDALRHHLLDVSPTRNLFVAAPLLGLPPALTQYLLHDTTLTAQYRDDDDFDDDVDDRITVQRL